MEKSRWFIGIVILVALFVGCAAKDMKLANRGSEAIVIHDYRSAEKYLDEALALNPDNPYALFNMGVVYEKTGRQQRAISMYQKVLELNLEEKDDQNNNDSGDGPSITELARGNLVSLQIEIARTSRFTEKPVLTMAEEPDLKDFFPTLKSPDLEASATDNTTGSVMAQEPETNELSSPSQISASTSDVEKEILEPLSPPPATPAVKEVEVSKPVAPPERPKMEPPTIMYSIQVASYKSLDGAVKRMAELIELGYDASYTEATVKGKGIWHRIFVDKFKSKQEALKQAQSMVDKKVISEFMIKVIE